MNLKEKLSQLASIKKSNWCEKVKWRKDNNDWLIISRRIALSILNFLDKKNLSKEKLSIESGIPLNEINQILKGRENLNLSQLVKLGKVLNTNFINTNIV